MLGAAGGLVLANGFFVAAEFAYVKVRQTRIEQLSQEGHALAKVALVVLKDLDGHLSATQFGITLASLGLGWIGEPTLEGIFSPPLKSLGAALAAASAAYSGPAVIKGALAWLAIIGRPSFIHAATFLLAFAIMTWLHIVFGELIPKSVALVRAEQIALWTARPLHWFYTMFRLPIRLLHGTGAAVLARFNIHGHGQHEAHDGEELRMLAEASAEAGRIDETERDLLDKVLEFSETCVREICVHRSDMACLYVDHPLDESIAYALAQGYTRYPLCEGEKDNVIGFIHVRDLFQRQQSLASLKEIMRPIMVMPETMSIGKVLRRFQAHKSQIAIVIDEYGGTGGMVTLEDVLEEVVGPISDEFDGDSEPEVKTVTKDQFDLDGAMNLGDFQDQFGYVPSLAHVQVDTIGGYVMSVLGTMPDVGAEIMVGPFNVRIKEVDGYRIERVELIRRTEDASPVA